MSAVFPINDDPRWREHTASAGQTVFPVPYPFQDNADIVIRKIALDGTETVLAEPAGYTLTGAGNPVGGSYTLTVPATAGEKYLSYGDAVMNRTQSIVRSGRYSSSATDSDLDRTVIRDQEMKRDIGRSLKLPISASVPGEGHFPIFGADGQMRDGGSAGDIQNAQENAEISIGARDAAEGWAAEAKSMATSLPLTVGVSLWRYNVKGDGNADDTGGLLDAAQELSTGGRLIIPEGRFVLTGSIPWAAGMHLEMHPNAVVEFTSSSDQEAFRWAGALGLDAVEASSDVKRGNTSITVDAGDEVLVTTGDVIKIETTDIFAPARLATIRDGELAVVRSTASGVINLFGVVKGNYLLANGTVTLRKVSVIDRPTVTGGKFLASGINNGFMALRVDQAFMPYVAGVQFSGFDDRAIYFGDCLDPVTERIYVENAESSGTGYGVSWGNCTHGGLLLNSRFKNVRHAASTNNESAVPGVVRGCKALHNVIEYSAPATGGSAGDAMDTHAGSSDIEYSYNKIYGATGVGINMEGRNCRAHGNEIYSSGSHGISVATYPEEKGWVDIKDNKIFKPGQDGVRVSTAITANAVISGIGTVVVVKENVVEDAVSVSAWVRALTAGQKNELVVMEDNTANRGQNTTVCLNIDGADTAVYRGNKGSGNASHFFRAMNITDLAGDHGYVEFDSGRFGRCVSIESVTGRTNLTGGRGKGDAAVGLNVSDSVNNVTSVGYDAAACATPFNWGAGTGHRKVGAGGSVSTAAYVIVSGAITIRPWDSFITIDTEALAATDDLDTINGGIAGQSIMISAASSDRTVVIKDGTQLKTSTDQTLDHVEDVIMLVFNGAIWREVAFSDNNT